MTAAAKPGTQAAAEAHVAAALRRYERRRLPQARALQRIEEDNAWARRPAPRRPGGEPLSASYARVAWGATAVLLAAAAALPLPAPLRARRSLFEAIMATTAPYNTLRAGLLAAPVLVAGLLFGGAAAARWAVLAATAAVAAAGA